MVVCKFRNSLSMFAIVSSRRLKERQLIGTWLKVVVLCIVYSFMHVDSERVMIQTLIELFASILNIWMILFFWTVPNYHIFIRSCLQTINSFPGNVTYKCWNGELHFKLYDLPTYVHTYVPIDSIADAYISNDNELNV